MCVVALKGDGIISSLWTLQTNMSEFQEYMREMERRDGGLVLMPSREGAHIQSGC